LFNFFVSPDKVRAKNKFIAQMSRLKTRLWQLNFINPLFMVANQPFMAFYF